MSSPYVRRRRLSDELARLLEEHGYSADQLASATGLSKQRISRISRCQVRPSLDEILRILDHFDADHERRRTITDVARDAQERGWWERQAAQMGLRQALYADLEWGAATICEYQLTFVPGLLQTELFSRARIAADKAIYRVAFDAERAVAARQTRQRLLQQPGGPVYEVVMDELAIRRLAAPVRVVAAQLDHLVDLGHHHDRVRIRVLPTDAQIDGHAVPRSAFSIYRYPDPGDPVVVAVDTATSDLVLTRFDDVEPYLALYARLHAAALSPADSLDFLAALAGDLPHEEHHTEGANYAHQI
ncbi:helix-turn-helix domain-containing protein [Paractinoplanes rishiriensis]|uniref:Transcriptional regulator n=1 Tax=Paractinoplanes rishiriensis TaxID=1050105 RepID=A0A919K5C2_9ACTN|nr:helix-turn-helix transcriptional regulator [Actinoplanes rishiriensis]GIF01116.1 transcriptional regulator [Actinoplanes rishiriensis]